MNDECLFCQIASGKIASDIVYEDNDVVAFTDVSPGAPTHLLIVPRVHLASLNDTDTKDIELLGKMMRAAITLAKEHDLAEGGYRLVINTGKDAGQTVGHIHLHLLGGRSLSWPPG